MATNKKYRIWCVTEAAYVYEWATSEPADCPNDVGHTIDATQTTITEIEPVDIYTTLNFYEAGNPYIQFDNTSWKTIAAFRYQGTDKLPISKFICMVSREGTTGTSYWRMRDTTNDNTIGSNDWTTSPMSTKPDGSLQNLPTGNANFELQVKIDASSSKGRMWSCTILREA